MSLINIELARQARRRQRVRVTHWCVDAGGVPAEWDEVTAATSGQPTLIYFYVLGDGKCSRQRNRQLAATLALSTGARVLSVGCRVTIEDPLSTAIEDAVNAYRWLLGEGCELDTTAFIGDPIAIADAVVLVARERGLPVPGAGDMEIPYYRE